MKTRVERTPVRTDRKKAKKIFGVVLLALSLLAFVLCIFPKFLNLGTFFQGLFGVVSYPLFLLLALVGIALILGMNYTFDKKYTAYITIAFICVLCLAHTIFCSKVLLNDYTAFSSFKDYLAYCYHMKGGFTVGGATMGIFVYLVRSLIGLGGTYVFYAIFATVFIGLTIDYAIYSKGKNKRQQVAKQKPSFRRMNDQEAPIDEEQPYTFSPNKEEQKIEALDREPEPLAGFEPFAPTEEFNAQKVTSLFETQDDRTKEHLDTSRDVEFTFNREENRIEAQDQSESRLKARSTLFGTNFGEPIEDNNTTKETGPVWGNPTRAVREETNFWGDPSRQESEEEQSNEPKSAREVLFGSAPTVPNIFDRSSEERDAWRRQYTSKPLSYEENNENEQPTFSNPFDLNAQRDQDEDNNKSLVNDQDSDVVRTSWGTYRPTPPVNRFNSQSPIEEVNQSYNQGGGFNSNVRDRNSIRNNMFNEPKTEELNRNTILNNNSRPMPKTTISNLNKETNDNQDVSSENTEFGSRLSRVDRVRRGSDLLADASSLGSLGIDAEEKPKDEFVSIVENQREVKREVTKPKQVEKISFESQLNTQYNAPPTNILNVTKEEKVDYSAEYREKTAIIETTLANFKIPAKVNNVVRGPKVTRYELVMPQGIPVSRVLTYEKDLSMGLASRSGVRIEAPIPGKNAFGIEVENAKPSMVGFRELVESNEFKTFKHPLPVAIGKNISGEIIVKSLGKMVHCLVAGSTGSGKSVFLHSLIVSLMYRHSPEELRFIMIDPKRVEFSRYNRMPHLMLPEVVTECSKAVNSLTWAVKEMERRYELLRVNECQKLEQFNECAAVKEGREKKLPYLVIVVDELAELMSVAAKEAESKIQRITQLGRAAGIHMVIATQRPSVDVVTGVIKNNLPTRIAFALASAIDSQTIINQGGAEKLLGQGDMLLSAQDSNAIVRLQAAFVSDEEIKKVLNYIKANNVSVYDEEIQKSIYAEPEPEQPAEEDEKTPFVSGEDRMDEYMPQALKLVMKNGKASISMIQRRFCVGYARAARIIDQMETRGFIASGLGNKPRDVIITIAEYNELFGDFDAE